MTMQAANALTNHNYNPLTTNNVFQNQNSPSYAIPQSFMHDLARKGDVLGAEIVFERGHSIDLKDETGKRPLHEAAFFGHIDMVKFLIEGGAYINAAVETSGHTPLYLAVQQNHYEIIRYLINKGADVNVIDKASGRGLLHIASKKNDIQLAGILISAGINVLHSDLIGVTARDIAAMNNHKMMEKILLKTMEHHYRGKPTLRA